MAQSHQGQLSNAFSEGKLLNSKNRVKWAIVSLLGFQYLLNLIHSWSMCLLVLIGYLLHGHANSSLGKNLSQYSPIGAWLTMALVALAHSEFEWLKYFSHDPPFTYISSILLRSSSRWSINFLPLLSNTLNVTLHFLINSSHLFFRLNSHEDLHGNSGVKLNLLVSLSTTLWSNQLSLLGQSQNSRELWSFLSKNCLISIEMEAVWMW